MKNVVPFPQRERTAGSAEDLHATIAVLREVVGQLCERVELLEARAALNAAAVPVEG